MTTIAMTAPCVRRDRHSPPPANSRRPRRRPRRRRARAPHPDKPARSRPCRSTRQCRWRPVEPGLKAERLDSTPAIIARQVGVLPSVRTGRQRSTYQPSDFTQGTPTHSPRRHRQSAAFGRTCRATVAATRCREATNRFNQIGGLSSFNPRVDRRCSSTCATALRRLAFRCGRGIPARPRG